MPMLRLSEILRREQKICLELGASAHNNAHKRDCSEDPRPYVSSSSIYLCAVLKASRATQYPLRVPHSATHEIWPAHFDEERRRDFSKE